MICNVYTIIVKLSMLNLFKMFVNKSSEKEIDFLNKKSLMIVIIILMLILGGIFLKMKYDEKKYYDEQKERITIYMKHNVKGYKNISFTNCKENPMDGYSISGYINNDRKLSFTAGIRSIDDFQFDTDISYTDELGRKFIKNPKSVSEIKKELNTSNK